MKVIFLFLLIFCCQNCNGQDSFILNRVDSLKLSSLILNAMDNAIGTAKNQIISELKTGLIPFNIVQVWEGLSDKYKVFACNYPISHSPEYLFLYSVNNRTFIDNLNVEIFNDFTNSTNIKLKQLEKIYLYRKLFNMGEMTRYPLKIGYKKYANYIKNNKNYYPSKKVSNKFFNSRDLHPKNFVLINKNLKCLLRQSNENVFYYPSFLQHLEFEEKSENLGSVNIEIYFFNCLGEIIHVEIIKEFKYL